MLAGGVRGWLARGALAVGVLGAAAPAQAAFHGTNGAIAFVSTRTGSAHVMRLDPSGVETDLSVASQLGTATDPAWSPDGTKIAFAHAGGIWTMNPDGKKPKLLTGTSTNLSDPAWSPDGTRLAYIDSNAANPEIYLMTSSGKNRTRLTQNTLIEHGLTWSPDGARIAFDGHDPAGVTNRQIYSVDVATGATTNLSNTQSNDTDPDYSPDGTQLTFVSDQPAGASLFTMPADGSGRTSVGTPNPYQAATTPAWSPDGSLIVLGANEGTGSLQLWETTPGGALSQLTHDTGNPGNSEPSWQPLHHTTLESSAPSAARGSKLTLTGDDFLGVQTVKLAYVASDGSKTSLGKVVTDVAGSFSKTVTVPSTVTVGNGTLRATGIGGLAASAPLTVT